MKIAVISPYAAKLRNGKNNPKNYPYWTEMVRLLKERGFCVVQIGVQGEEKIEGVDEFLKNLSFKQLTELVWQDQTLLFSVDSFFPHFCRSIGRACIVLWGKSDPTIFGYKENINILRDRKYLRSPHDQWLFWENETFDAEVFTPAKNVIDFLESNKIIFS